VVEKGGYQLHTYEPVTDLCRRSFGMGSRLTEAMRRGTGAVDGFESVKLAPADLGPRVANRLAAPFEEPYGELDSTRAGAVDDFIAGLPSDERSFSLLHIALPHIFWEFMPDGSHYLSNRFTGVDSLTSPESKDQIDSDFQQYMLQLQFTDHELFRIVRRMKEQGTWDESLFVVTADHGAGFIPGGSRRILEDANSGWILPVPLFIKYPGQETGEVVPGGASSIDIAPTISDVLGVDPPPGSEGTSLAGKSKLPSSAEITAHGAFGTVQMKRGMVERLRRKATRQTNATFPGGRLFALAGHAGLLGQAPANVKGLEPVEAIIDQAAELSAVDPSSGEIPSYVKAATPGLPAGTPVAVALNGRLVATTATWDETASGRVVTAVNLPSGDFVEGANTVTFREITGSARQ